MPDVDAEWARFEQEVIGKETKASKRSLYSWIGSFAIAASVVIVAGLFFLNHDSRETEQILTETSEHPISHEVVSEPSSSEKPTELIAKTSPTKQVKIRRENNTATDYIYDCDEESAVFPGGEEALKAFIEANLELPDLATEYGAKGRIFMSFVIDSVGEVSDIRILERPRARISYDTPRLSQEPEDTQVKIKELITHQLGEEGTRILSLMPRWRPAIWGGKPRKTRYHLPIIFDATKTERQELLAKNQDIKPDSFKDLEKSLQHQPHKDTNPKGSIAGMAPRKELALANADAPATTGLDIPAREYAGAVQKPKEDGLGSGTTMRLRGTGSGPIDKDRIDSTLILVNGEPLPDSLKQRIMGDDMDDIDTYMPRYFSQQGLMIDSVYVHKDSYYTEKYGGRAKYGMIEIKVVPDTYCDAYVRKHPKLMKKYTRVEGYVMNNEDKPLTEAWVHVKRERALLKEHPELDFVGAATDSTGHYVIWLPKDIDITLCAEQTGYKSFEFSPSDKNLVMQLETGASMRLRGNPVPTPELQGVIAGLPDAPPNDSLLYIVNGVPQPKENNKWLSKRSFLDYFHGQHLLVDSVKRNMNEEAKQRYLERFGMAAKHGVVEYFCVEDTLCDYYMNQHEELKASRRRVSGVVLDENDEPLDHTIIHILQFEPEKKIWGVETTDSLGNFAFWVPRTDVKLHFKYIGYKTIVVEPTDTFLTVRLVPNSVMRSMK